MIDSDERPVAPSITEILDQPVPLTRCLNAGLFELMRKRLSTLARNRQQRSISVPRRHLEQRTSFVRHVGKGEKWLAQFHHRTLSHKHTAIAFG